LTRDNYRRHHIIKAAVNAGVITEIKPGRPPGDGRPASRAFGRGWPVPPALIRSTPSRSN